ncbi:MAG: substrate-binding domain-containing protein [Solirubrobacterales bacterium]
MKRKWILVSALSALVLGLCLAACGGGGSTSDATTGGDSTGGGSTATSTSGVTTKEILDELGVYCKEDCQKALDLEKEPSEVDCSVAYLNGETGNDYQAAMAQKADEYGKKWFPNMDLTVLDGQGDPAVQTSQMETEVAKGVSTIILLPIVADALAPAVERAEEAGVNVILVDRTVPAEVTTTVKGDDEQVGKEMGEYIAEQVGEKPTNVVLLSGTPGASPTIARRDGFKEVLSQHPNIKLLTEVNGEYNQAAAFPVAANLFSRYDAKELNWIASMADEMSLGVLKAAEAAGRTGSFQMIANNGADIGLEAIEAGEYDATVVYPQAMPQGLVAAARVCSGEEVPKQITLSSPLITKENAKEYIGTNYP